MYIIQIYNWVYPDTSLSKWMFSLHLYSPCLLSRIPCSPSLPSSAGHQSTRNLGSHNAWWSHSGSSGYPRISILLLFPPAHRWTPRRQAGAGGIKDTRYHPRFYRGYPTWTSLYKSIRCLLSHNLHCGIWPASWIAWWECACQCCSFLRLRISSTLRSAILVCFESTPGDGFFSFGRLRIRSNYNSSLPGFS